MPKFDDRSKQVTNPEKSSLIRRLRRFTRIYKMLSVCWTSPVRWIY